MNSSAPAGDTSTFEVPRIIHQTWKISELPPFIDQCVRTVKDRHPDWDYRFHTDDDWGEILDENPFIDPDDFWRIPTGIQRADVSRMLILYRDGGVYLDVDFLAVRSLDSLIASANDSGIVDANTDVLLSTDHPVHCNLLYSGREPLMNHFLIARPEASAIGSYLTNVISRLGAMNGNNDPVMTTGPLALTDIIEEFDSKKSGKISIFPYFWTHALPDMSRDFVERSEYSKIIRDGSWRTRFCPYFLHCWWHTYYKEENMIGEFGWKLLADMGYERPAIGSGVNDINENADEMTPEDGALRDSPNVVRKIWQVCASVETLPEEYRACRESWIDMNPGWEIEMATDESIRNSFAEDMPEFLEVFDSLPLGVMKADMWRYAVLLVNGGLYADTDTYCLKPISSWLFPHNLDSMHICPEGGFRRLCQWAFYSPPNHPVLRRVLELISERVEADGGVDLDRPHSVHYYTGPDVWTEAVRQVLGIAGEEDEVASGSYPKPGFAIEVHPPGFFANQAIQHGFASFEWGGTEYASWRDTLRGKLIEDSRSRADRLKQLLKPRITGPLKRYGGRKDGAFVLREDLLKESAYLLSLGNDDAFDLEVADEGIEVITVVRGIAEDATVTLDAMVNVCDSQVGQPTSGAGDPALPEESFTLKIDAEGSEYRLIQNCSHEVLERCCQLAVEFHNLPNGGELNGVGIDATWDEREAVVMKILETHFLVHIHGNNHSSLIHGFPEVVECLFVNRKCFTDEPPVWRAGSPRSGLDWPNLPGRPQHCFDWWTRECPERPRFALISLWTHDLGKRFDDFARNKDAYCERHGYGCHIYQELFERDRAPAWSKIPAIQRHIQDYEWVFWLDADAVITNHGISLEELVDPHFDIIISTDHFGINAGSFLIRNTPRSREFLQRIWEKEEAEPFWEQSAMSEVIPEMPELKIKKIPKRKINSYWNDYREGDFILHAPGEQLDLKIKLLTVALRGAS